MKNKKIIPLIVLISFMGITACNKSSGGEDKPGTNPDIPDVNPGAGKLQKMLEQDYSNCTVLTASLYKESPDDLPSEVVEYDSLVYYYKGYSILYDELRQEMGIPNPYLYYHDYQNENYLYFESDDGRDCWLKDNGNGLSYALRTTEFYLPDFLTKLDPEKATYAAGMFYIMDKAEVARLNREVFAGIWNNDIQEVVIVPDAEGKYVSRIYGFEEEGNEDEYVAIQIGNIGTTNFYDSYLPPEPNSENVMEFWQYKGWVGPEKKVYPDSATLTAYDAEYQVETVNMEIEDDFRIEYSLHFPTETGDFHFVEVGDVSFVSSNPNVAIQSYGQHYEQRLDSKGRKIYTDNKPGDTHWIAIDDEGNVYQVNGVDPIEDEIDLTAFQPLMDLKYHQTIKAVGAGDAEIYIIASSEQDTKEFNYNPKYGVHSNSIKVHVKGLDEIDKTDASYNFEFTGIGENEVVMANNKINNSYPYDITSVNASLLDGKNSDLFEEGKQYLVLDPTTSTDEHGPRGNSGITFDFGDQQVSKLEFYYGFFYANSANAKDRLTDAKLETSNDGETWTTVDITDLIKSNISKDYKKLFSMEFAPASKVRIKMHSNMVGGTYSYKMGLEDVTFSSNSECHTHGTSTDVPVTQVSVSGLNQVRIGNTITLVAGVLPNNATNKTVTWESSDETVATINASGVVTPIKAGTTEITATAASGVKSNPFTVTVLGELTLPSKFAGMYADDFDYPSYKAVVDATNKTMVFTQYSFGNDPYEVTLTLTDGDEASREYVFANGTDKIKACYSGDGSEFYIATGGASKINGKDIQGSHTLNKGIAPTSMTLKVTGATANAGKYEMIAGDTCVVTATLTPTNANYNKELTWTSSDNTIGSFSTEDHKFTAKKAGTVTLTATSEGGLEASVTFVISEEVLAASLTISGANNGDEIVVGCKVQLTANYPANTNRIDLVWSTSDSTIATINNGLVTTKKAGTVTITVTDNKSGLKASVTLTVKEDAGAGVNIPVALQGTYDDEYESGATLTVEADKIVVEYYGETYEFTLESIDGNTYNFSDGVTMTYNSQFIFVDGLGDASDDLFYIFYDDSAVFARQ